MTKAENQFHIRVELGMHERFEEIKHFASLVDRDIEIVAVKDYVRVKNASKNIDYIWMYTDSLTTFQGRYRD